MTSFGERLKELRKSKNLTQEQLANIFYLNKSSISRYENNTQLPENDLLQSIADFFQISVDYLLGRDDSKEVLLNDKDKKDIEKALNKTMSMLEAQEGLMLSGNPVDDEDWELLKSSIQRGLEYAKLKNKEKYTPKKYKK